MKIEATVPEIIQPKFSKLKNGTIVWYGRILWMKIEESDYDNAICLSDGSRGLIIDSDCWFEASVKIVNDPQEFNA